MARADLLKKLFRGYKIADRQLFIDAAREIIEEERKKSHLVLANELTRILENGKTPLGIDVSLNFEPLPKDSDRGFPLLEVRWTDRYIKDLVLTEDQHQILKDIMNEFRQWEVLEANGLKPGNKVLFCGPPGCGKTATAEALAGELGLPLLYVRFDSVVSSLLGETAANLRKVFDYASRGLWVVLFDEFDAIGRSRDDVTEHGELKRVVNSFLQLLDQFTGRSLLIAATNFEQSLDPALWRRFDEIIRFEKPNLSEIESLLDKKLASQPKPRFSMRSIVSKLEGMSHAEIERVCMDVLRDAALKGVSGFTRQDLERAIAKQERRQRVLLKSRASGPPKVDKGE